MTSKRRPPKSRAVVFALLILWTTPGLAQEEEPPIEIRMERLEARLAEARGRDRFEILVELAELASAAENFTKVLSFGEEARALLPSEGDPNRELILASALTAAYANKRNLGPARAAARRAEELARDLDDTKALARFFFLMGNIHRYQAEHEKALESYAEARRLYEALGEHGLVGHVLNNSSIIHHSFGDYAEALRLRLLARLAFDRAGNLAGVALTSQNIGHVYNVIGQEEAAEASYRQSLAFAIEAGAEVEQAGALRYLGALVLDQGEPQRALELLRRALEIYLRLDAYQTRRGDTYTLIGEAWAALGNDSRALEHLHRALDLATEIDDQSRRNETLSTIARVHHQRGELETAIGLLEQATEVAREHHHLRELQNTLHNLQQTYAEAGRYRQAYEALEEYEALKSESLGEESRRALAELQAGFEAQEREKTIELLEKDQALQRAELESQHNLRSSLTGGFALLLIVLVLLFNRYRLKSREAHMHEAVERERAASQRLRQVDKLKDEFLANTSHELRTPLYGITGLAESLIDGVAGELPETAEANLSMIVGSSRRLGRLVDDILDYSRLTHGSLKLQRRPVDLRPLVEVVLTLQGPLVGSKDLALINAVPPDLPAVDADEARLEQILHNLVGNAVKFTEEGKVEVSASVEKGPTEGGQAQRPTEDGQTKQLVVTVDDTGIGIPEDKREQIFEAFEQADSGVQRTFGGTGLGLTVTRELVELHGGQVRVESTSGQGTRFSFTLPISREQAGPRPAGPATSSEQPISRLLTAEASAAVLQPSASTERPAAPAGLSPLDARILVVDDEPVNLQVLSNHLASAGYDVELAASGSEALGLTEKCLTEKRAFDLVVLDVMMPVMSGYEVCRALRERHSLDDLPVIFLTARNQVSDLVAGLAAGGSDYLTKPISKDELLARVRTHLELLSVHRQLTRVVGDLEARNAELASFNYTVAHDLKNPLTTIKNFLGLARLDAASGKAERLASDFDFLDDAAEKLQRLLDQLFKLSQVGVQTNPPEEVAVGELVGDALAQLAGSIAERGVEVEVAPDLPVVTGDRARLLEAVRHLLDNAVQYLGDQPSPRIEVGVRATGTPTEPPGGAPPGGAPPTFYVSDNGMGIDPEYHDKIFGLFERLEPEASEGTGIGLALVKRIVEAHGGRISVESQGRASGSTFCFTLPGDEGDSSR